MCEGDIERRRFDEAGEMDERIIANGGYIDLMNRAKSKEYEEKGPKLIWQIDQMRNSVVSFIKS